MCCVGNPKRLPAEATPIRKLAGPIEDFAARETSGGLLLLACTVIALVWAFAHHLLAGLRHLAMDAGIGWRLRHARASARVAIAGGLVFALAVALVIWPWAAR